MQIKELGHVVLYVTDIKKMTGFYRDILGFRQIGEIGFDSGEAVAFSSGRTHHELLLIEVGMPAEAGVESKNSRVPKPGLYHIGFKVADSAEELKKVYKELKGKDVRIVGMSDHTVTHSLYILDPDGNELELYADVSDEWRTNPEAVLTPAKKLDLES